MISLIFQITDSVNLILLMRSVLTFLCPLFILEIASSVIVLQKSVRPLFCKFVLVGFIINSALEIFGFPALAFLGFMLMDLAPYLIYMSKSLFMARLLSFWSLLILNNLKDITKTCSV